MWLKETRSFVDSLEIEYRKRQYEKQGASSNERVVPKSWIESRRIFSKSSFGRVSRHPRLLDRFCGMYSSFAVNGEAFRLVQTEEEQEL